jgi:nucleoside-diphosphate-sugar epimerase
MRVFIAGATGAIGRQLVPKLIERGHQVFALTRSARSEEAARALGAESVEGDALDRESVIAAIKRAEPEVVVNELTAIGKVDLRNLDRSFELTNRLRTEGTDALLAGAVAVGARRFIAQGFGGWPYARVGGWVKTEEDPLDDDPPLHTEQTLAAMKHLESAVTGAREIEGIVLRYGGFYGPATSLAPGGQQAEDIRRRRFPIVGNGQGRTSFMHVEDGAEATVLAIEATAPSPIYNIVDDDPAPVAEWLPYLAKVLGAKPPLHVPAWVARLMAGRAAVVWSTEGRGASNARAKRELCWEPRFGSWREGFAATAM